MLFSYHFRQSALSTAALLVLLSVCKKDTPAPDADTSLLASHPWHIVAFADTDNTVNPPKTVDVFVRFPAYRLDDTYWSNIDNSLTFDEGILKDNTADEQSAAGKWQFQNEQKSLIITLNKAVALGTGSTSSSTYSILKLSTDTLRLTHGTQAQTVVVTLIR